MRSYLIESDNRRAAKSLNLKASIEDDLGIDSIARAEILRLLEKEFSVAIDDRLLLEAETLSVDHASHAFVDHASHAFECRSCQPCFYAFLE